MARLLRTVSLAGVLAVTACGPDVTGPDFIYDPEEEQNREMHQINLALDRVLVRPTSIIYGTVVPRPWRIGLSNVVNNLGEPSRLVNHLLQGDVDAALITFARFAVNTVLGIAGLIDVAKMEGIEEQDTDFGETLAVWGVREGAFIMLPALGPSTERDAVGFAVDIVLNPARYILPVTANTYITFGEALDIVGDRYEFRDVIDALLYESADSYAALRLSYLQSRRREIAGGEEQQLENLEDIYAEF